MVHSTSSLLHSWEHRNWKHRNWEPNRRMRFLHHSLARSLELLHNQIHMVKPFRLHRMDHKQMCHSKSWKLHIHDHRVIETKGRHQSSDHKG